MAQTGATRSLTDHDFVNPRDDRWLEDYTEGDVFEYGWISVSEQEIIEFARQYDPQSIHVDRRSAAAGPFEGLIASGWHTSALFMRLFVDHFLTAVGSLTSPGVDELRWTAPVRPGDELRARITIEKSRRSRSKPDRGIVHTYCEMFNQDGVPVLSLRAMNLIAARESAH